MLQSMYSAVTGLNASNQRMAVIGDNIANVNTTAYKSSELSFQSLINQSVGGYTGQEIGGGVLGGHLSYDWNQGTIQKTSNPYDMAIAGSGFFIVSDESSATPVQYYTRDGEFSFDSDGYLKTSTGLHVQGFAVDPTTGQPTGTTSGDLVDIQIEPYTVDSSGTASGYKDVTVDSNGTYWATDTTGNRVALFQVGLCKTTDPNLFAKYSNNLYVKTTDNITDPLLVGVPGSGGLGTVESSALEASNVDIAKEFVNMIEAQRAFTANSKVITASDGMLQDLVSMVR